MNVPDEVLKCVVFVGMRKADGSYCVAGTGFLTGNLMLSDDLIVPYVVTAKHVIEAIERTGLTEVYLRANTHSGQAEWLKTESRDWKHHPSEPNVDLAAIRSPIGNEFDHRAVPPEMFLTLDVIRELEVGLGDEVFITGLFRHHYGGRRNIPIVRIGNIAALDEEQVVTQAYGPMTAFLIESRSIGGLSGSPVFVNFGGTRALCTGIVHGGPRMKFLGRVFKCLRT